MSGDPATDLFTDALRAMQAMVMRAARESIPKSKFLPTIDFKPWDPAELRACAELFDRAVTARIAPGGTVYRDFASEAHRDGRAGR